jgi:hypothetical protein
MPFSRSQNSIPAKKSAFITHNAAAPSGEQKSRKIAYLRLSHAGQPALYRFSLQKLVTAKRFVKLKCASGERGGRAGYQLFSPEVA